MSHIGVPIIKINVSNRLVYRSEPYKYNSTTRCFILIQHRGTRYNIVIVGVDITEFTWT